MAKLACVDHARFQHGRYRVPVRCQSGFPHLQLPLFTHTIPRRAEKQFLIAARDMVEAATGQQPVGYNCNWLRRGPNTLSLLELGYLKDEIARFVLQSPLTLRESETS